MPGSVKVGAGTRQSDSGQAQKPATAVIPFPRASRLKSQQSFTFGPQTLGVAGVPFGPIQIPANGYLRSLTLDCTITSTGNSATVTLAGAGADAPFNLFSQVAVTTSSGDNLITPVSGYALAMMQKYGAFGDNPPYDDPRTDPGFSNLSTGAGATAGSGRFRVRIPFEIDASSGFCSVPNLAANRAYYITGVLNALSNMFGVAPNGAVTATITATADYWAVPNSTNAAGDPQSVEPVGTGAFSIWQYESAVVNAGVNLVQSHNVGNVLREIILIFRAANVRNSSNFPSQVEVLLNNDLLFFLPVTEWTRELATATGYGCPVGATIPALDAPQGLDTGVYVLSQFLAPGASRVANTNPRDQYLPTLDATLLQFRCTSFGAGGTLEIYTNSIVTDDAKALYAPHF